MTDINLTPAAYPGIKGFLADLARPVAIYAASGSAAVATVLIAMKIDKPDLSSAAIFIGAVFSGVSALYWGKAWEQSNVAKQAANVQVAQATAAPPTGQ